MHFVNKMLFFPLTAFWAIATGSALLSQFRMNILVRVVEFIIAHSLAPYVWCNIGTCSMEWMLRDIDCIVCWSNEWWPTTSMLLDRLIVSVCVIVVGVDVPLSFIRFGIQCATQLTNPMKETCHSRPCDVPSRWLTDWLTWLDEQIFSFNQQQPATMRLK